MSKSLVVSIFFFSTMSVISTVLGADHANSSGAKETPPAQRSLASVPPADPQIPAPDTNDQNNPEGLNPEHVKALKKVWHITNNPNALGELGEPAVQAAREADKILEKLALKMAKENGIANPDSDFSPVPVPLAAGGPDRLLFAVYPKQEMRQGNPIDNPNQDVRPVVLELAPTGRLYVAPSNTLPPGVRYGVRN